MHKSIYTRPDKPKYKPVNSRQLQPEKAVVELPQIITVDAATHCHITPEDVAARMVDYLAPIDGRVTLEPEAGTGSLVQALLNVEVPHHGIVAIERHYTLYDHLTKRFENNQSVNVLRGCFLEYATEINNQKKFSQILMNPPFKDVRKHMAAALSLLGSNDLHRAVLVALVPITYEHEDAETCEILDRGTFANTQVLTKIVRFEY